MVSFLGTAQVCDQIWFAASKLTSYIVEQGQVPSKNQLSVVRLCTAFMSEYKTQQSQWGA